MNEVLKYYGRLILQIPSVYRESNRNHIFIFSTRRSGSTLLRDIIYSQPGFNYIDQPFDIWQYNPYLCKFPEVIDGQLISLHDRSLKELKRYVDNILARKYIVRSQWSLWRKGYHWSWDRYVVKILNANAMIHWFEEVFGDRVKIIFLIRHPVPTSQSIIKRNWGLTARAYLSNKYFREKYLSTELVTFGNKILNEGTILEKHILNWCLVNLVPLRNWKNDPWLTISYENLISNPQEWANRLSDLFDLPRKQKMLDTIRTPTRTTVDSSRKAILSVGPEERIYSWKNKTSPKDLRRVENILDRFQISFYNVDHPFPTQDLEIV